MDNQNDGSPRAGVYPGAGRKPNFQTSRYTSKGGLDMKTMLDVVNVSTGQNFVTEQVFPRYVLTETYASAGAAAIIRKDLSLFIEAAEAEGRQHDIATAALNFIEEFDDTMPGVDQLRMYPFIRDRQ